MEKLKQKVKLTKRDQTTIANFFSQFFSSNSITEDQVHSAIIDSSEQFRLAVINSIDVENIKCCLFLTSYITLFDKVTLGNKFIQQLSESTNEECEVDQLKLFILLLSKCNENKVLSRQHTRAIATKLKTTDDFECQGFILEILFRSTPRDGQQKKQFIEQVMDGLESRDEQLKQMLMNMHSNDFHMVSREICCYINHGDAYPKMFQAYVLRTGEGVQLKEETCAHLYLIANGKSLMLLQNKNNSEKITTIAYDMLVGYELQNSGQDVWFCMRIHQQDQSLPQRVEVRLLDKTAASQLESIMIEHSVPAHRVSASCHTIKLGQSVRDSGIAVQPIVEESIFDEQDHSVSEQIEEDDVEYKTPLQKKVSAVQRYSTAVKSQSKNQDDYALSDSAASQDPPAPSKAAAIKSQVSTSDEEFQQSLHIQEDSMEENDPYELSDASQSLKETKKRKYVKKRSARSSKQQVKELERDIEKATTSAKKSAVKVPKAAPKAPTEAPKKPAAKKRQPKRKVEVPVPELRVSNQDISGMDELYGLDDIESPNVSPIKDSPIKEEDLFGDLFKTTQERLLPMAPIHTTQAVTIPLKKRHVSDSAAFFEDLPMFEFDTGDQQSKKRRWTTQTVQPNSELPSLRNSEQSILPANFDDVRLDIDEDTFQYISIPKKPKLNLPLSEMGTVYEQIVDAYTQMGRQKVAEVKKQIADLEQENQAKLKQAEKNFKSKMTRLKKQYDSQMQSAMEQKEIKKLQILQKFEMVQKVIV